MALEQPNADLPFKLREALSQRWLRQPRRFRRSIKAAKGNHAVKRAQMPEVEIKWSSHAQEIAKTYRLSTTWIGALGHGMGTDWAQE